MIARSFRFFVVSLFAFATSSSSVGAFELPVTMDPVWDAPDPALLVEGDTVWVYTTNAAYLGNVPLWQSTESGFSYIGDALPVLGSWAVEGRTWAPGVAKIGGSYRLYYTATDQASGLQCIGLASAPAPAGPFRDSGARPIVCKTELGGSIDPQPFQDAAENWWLTWKSDGNAVSEPCGLWTVSVAVTGEIEGDGTRILCGSEVVPDGLVENPAMVYAEGKYQLFFSSGYWASESYVTYHAECEGPRGPCALSSSSPVLGSSSHLTSPGGASLARLDDGTWIFGFHAYLPGASGLGAPRHSHLATVDLSGPVPLVEAWDKAPPTGSGDCRSAPAPGAFDTRAHVTNAGVYRLYCATFLRYPDYGGFAYWVNSVERTLPLDSVGALFVTSEEFVLRYGSTSTIEFVTLLYQNTLQRDPDAAGLEYWTRLIDSGRLTRNQVLLGFSESVEFRTSTGTS